MKNLANDEITIDDDVFIDRLPTQKLRLRDVGHGRILLEQWWGPQINEISGAWIPVPFVGEET